MSTTLVESSLGCFCSSASARYASSDCASKPSSPRLLSKFTMPRPEKLSTTKVAMPSPSRSCSQSTMFDPMPPAGWRMITSGSRSVPARGGRNSPAT
jgi:hypothetical protein